jgi:hypothetical protein
LTGTDDAQSRRNTKTPDHDRISVDSDSVVSHFALLLRGRDDDVDAPVIEPDLFRSNSAHAIEYNLKNRR